MGEGGGGRGKGGMRRGWGWGKRWEKGVGVGGRGGEKGVGERGNLLVCGPVHLGDFAPQLIGHTDLYSILT